MSWSSMPLLFDSLPYDPASSRARRCSLKSRQVASLALSQRNRHFGARINEAKNAVRH